MESKWYMGEIVVELRTPSAATGLFSSGYRSYDVIPFINNETGEVKTFLERYVKERGSETIISELDSK